MTDATYATLVDAVFSMDAYERNPDDGSWAADLSQFFPNLVDDELGNYVLTAVSSSAELNDNNFLALAYTSKDTDQTIVSYRGTTNFLVDAYYGYGVGAGSPNGPDAADAVKFYQGVANLLDDPIQGATDITVVGHSLGGGLAGFVGAIYGLKGDLFDNMTFNTAAARAYSWSLTGEINDPIAGTFEYADPVRATVYGAQSPYPNDLSGLKAYATTGELLDVALPLRILQTPPVQHLDSHGGAREVVALHSMSLLTILLYADVNNETAWQDIGGSLINALYDDRLGAAIVASGEIGESFKAGQMRTIIAYSALDQGYEPFGTTALQSLFADADVLGGIQSAGQFTGFLTPDPAVPGSKSLTVGMSSVAALAEIAVQFAGDQAAAANTDHTLAQGALELDGSVLKADLDPSEWTSTFKAADHSSETTTAVVGLGDLVKSVLANVAAGLSQEDPTYAWAASNMSGFGAQLLKQLNEITEIDISLNGSDLSAAGALPAAHDGAPGGALLIGSDSQGSITGSDRGKDIIVGGKTVATGQGDDIIVTSTGPETITFGSGNNQVLAGGKGVNDTFDYTSKTGTDLIIGNSQGGDTFTFDGADQAAFTVVWGGSGNDTFDINTTSPGSSVNVLALNMSGVTASNITSLDMATLQLYLDKTYASGGNGEPTIVILNASSSDTLKYNGTVVISPGVASTGGSFVSTQDLGDDGFSVHVETGVTNQLTANGLSYSYGDSYSSLPTLSLVALSGPGSSGGLNLINFTDGEFGVSLDAGVGVPQDTVNSITNTKYLPPNNLTEQTPSGPMPAELGPVISSNTTDPNESDGSLVDPGILDGPAAPQLNINDYLVAGADNGGGGGGGDQNGGDGSAASVSISEFQSNQSSLDFQGSGFQVSDAAANISAAIDELNSDSRVVAIALTDNGTPTLQLDASQVANDGSALAEITNATYVIEVDDSAAEVSTNLDALNADSKVTAITLSDTGTPNLTLSVREALLDTAALGKITNATYGITISDTAADVSAAIDVIKANPKLSSITLIDSGTPRLDLSVNQALNDTSVLAKISNAAYAIQIEDSVADVLGEASALVADTQMAGITIVDTTADVIANASALAANTQITSIVVEDTAANILANASALSGNPQVKSTIVLDTVANVLANAASLQGDVTVVSDTVANVSAALDALNSSTSISAIELSDSGTPTLTLTVGQALGDTAALGKIANSSYSVNISDTTADVAAHLDALASDPRLGSIALTDAGATTLTISAAQVVADAAVLARISNTNVAIDVSGTAAVVAANFDAINSNSKVASIALTDGGTPTLTLTTAQALNDTATLAKISNATYSISLSDTATNVSNAIDALNSDATISSIALNGSGTPVLDLTAAQTLGDTTALGKITNGNYEIDVVDSAVNILADDTALVANSHVASEAIVDTAATVLAQAAVIAADAEVKSIIVLDTAADVSAEIDGLNANGKLSAIVLTDSGVPTLTLSVEQALNDGRAISSIINTNFKIAISDTAANVAASIDLLNADGAIGSIGLTDSGTPTFNLTVGQALADSRALSGITNPNYSIEVTGDAADVVKDAAELSADSKITGVSVTDTVANVSANFDALGAIASLDAITVTDGTSSSLVLSASQALEDTTELGKIVGPYSILVTDNVANVLADQAALTSDANVAYVEVTDTAANILNNSTALASDSKLIWVTASDTATNILANKSSLASDAQVRTVNVFDSAANIVANSAALRADSRLNSIVVVDTAANIAANIAALSQVTSGTGINLKIAGTPTLTLTVDEALDAANISGNFKIAVVDTTANIAANIDQLNWVSSIGSITPTDSGSATLSLTVSQVLFDGAALGSIATNTQIVVNDAAANVSASIDTLNAANAIASITLNDTGTPTLALTVKQALHDTNALGKITNTDYVVAVSDTAANVLAAATSLRANSRITSITVADTAANVIADRAALAVVPQVTAVTVVDTAANVIANSAALGGDSQVTAIGILDTAAGISANIDALNGLPGLSSIQLTDYNNLALSAAQALNDPNALGMVQNYMIENRGQSSFVNVSDSAANVLSNLPALTADQQVNSISIVDTAANVMNDLAALEAASFSGLITIEDSSATIEADLPTLNASSLNIQYSITAPRVEITSAAEGSNVATQTIAGTVNYWGSAVTPGQTVTLTDNGTTLGTAVLEADGTFATAVTLPNEGDNAIVASISDGRGNTGTSAVVVDTLDDIAPTITFTSVPEAGNAASQTITGMVISGGAAVVAGQTVTLTDNGTTLGTATVQANGSFTANETLTGDGANSIVATVTDTYGNIGTSPPAIIVLGTSSSATISGDGKAVSIEGSSDQVTLTGNGDTLSIGGNNAMILASGANETYLATTGSGQVIINNATSSGMVAQGQLDFSSGISEQNLWFAQSGNDLDIDILGSQDQFTLTNWFGTNPAAALSQITAGDGLKLDSSVLQLVQAMATYSSDNPGFSPAEATQMPTDPGLQSAISAAWH